MNCKRPNVSTFYHVITYLFYKYKLFKVKQKIIIIICMHIFLLMYYYTLYYYRRIQGFYENVMFFMS